MYQYLFNKWNNKHHHKQSLCALTISNPSSSSSSFVMGKLGCETHYVCHGAYLALVCVCMWVSVFIWPQNNKMFCCVRMTATVSTMTMSTATITQHQPNVQCQTTTVAKKKQTMCQIFRRWKGFKYAFRAISYPYHTNFRRLNFLTHFFFFKAVQTLTLAQQHTQTYIHTFAYIYLCCIIIRSTALATVTGKFDKSKLMRTNLLSGLGSF